ncbi:Eukaryotic translation initiation factor 4 gamma type 5 [Trypanosoma equiperdum]|uniref:MIF4G domain-containing protein n=2 Tax=Trypanozoon TaxID=39700 RepID=Q57VY5_TRYB2|nr:hypothetical protein, conserved [Trypanosoma brucei brucei TREU927]AAX70234.1 hypothetical protein, conserved [Trypanosoma brucei]AAZ13215.1 hypothetical protein, conserved [Trypanosoma brucei brucei TREU927]SCU69388.1 Eukaryotic translation initiation factor 4 gamma type 5 [Trypanosoma equiperdum]
MEHRAAPVVPPRIGSAPLTQGPSSFQRPTGRGIGFHRAGLGRGVNSGSPLHHQAAPSPSAGIFDRTSAPAPGTAESPVSSYPEDCVYEIAEFTRLQNTKCLPPKGILQFATDLWKEMPENNVNKPEHIFSREDLFQGESAPSKVMSERKLHNEVLGILGKVSEDNIELMKKELTNLPIRQSDDEEIEEVIRVIFHKSIQPEDSIFVQLYVKLIAHLISSIGDNEPAGRRIRSAIIRQSQNMFEKADDAQGKLEREIAGLPEDEAEQRRMNFAAKQKANINFLGLLFTHGLVREKVVLQILQWLLYGPETKRRIPADYEIIHFMNLLLTCGKDFSKEGAELVPHFRSVLQDLMHTHPQRRIQFLLLNTLETIDNNWVPRHGAAAAAARSSGDRGGNVTGTGDSERERHPLPPIPPPLKPVPSRDKFWAAMDKYFTAESLEEVSLLLADIPEETRIAYCSSIIHRYITTMRYADQRARLGELFEKLGNARVLPVSEVRQALRKHLRDAVEQDIFTDLPKYFHNWAIVIKGGRSVFPLSFHTDFLDMLVDCGGSRDHIANMLKEVQAVLSEGPKNSNADYDPKSRFRVLPALLRYSPPLLSGTVVDESDDILRQFTTYDTEVEFFNQLCDADGAKNVPLLNGPISRSLHHQCCLISAFFTFVRFDVEHLCREHKETLKRMVNSKQPLHQLLEEVFVAWQSLGRTPERAFEDFLKAVRPFVSPKDAFDKFKSHLTTKYGETAKEAFAAFEKSK